jgi:hypothetical protein
VAKQDSQRRWTACAVHMIVYGTSLMEGAELVDVYAPRLSPLAHSAGCSARAGNYAKVDAGSRHETFTR